MVSSFGLTTLQFLFASVVRGQEFEGWRVFTCVRSVVPRHGRPDERCRVLSCAPVGLARPGPSNETAHDGLSKTAHAQWLSQWLEALAQLPQWLDAQPACHDDDDDDDG